MSLVLRFGQVVTQIAQDLEGIVSLVVGLVISLVGGLVDLGSLVSENAGSTGEG